MFPNTYLHQERGTLPPNLHVQPRAKRFDPFGEETEGDSELERVTAFPGSNTIIVDPENRNSIGLILKIYDLDCGKKTCLAIPNWFTGVVTNVPHSCLTLEGKILAN